MVFMVSRKDLDDLKNLDSVSAKVIMDKLPLKSLAWLFAAYCSKDQIGALFVEYGGFVEDNDPVVREKYKKKLMFLVRCLKKKRKLDYIPVAFRGL